VAKGAGVSEAVAPAAPVAASPLATAAGGGSKAREDQQQAAAARPGKTKSGIEAVVGAAGAQVAGTAAQVAAAVAEIDRAARAQLAKKAAQVEEVVLEVEKVARDKRDKLVRHSVELLKSEEAAIEALRAELAQVAGWAASRSDILRAGVRLFAEQKVDQMKELLAALADVPKGRKKS
jgi:hypothetical protein